MSMCTPSLPPGFRFHPTDEELIVHYLTNQVASMACPVPIIAEVDIYKHDPWDLPGMALFGETEWYFFSPRDRKHPNGVRPNRAAGLGYWKATGTDKTILSAAGNENIGVKKALVFYKGKPPRGVKTDWIMREYRLTGAHKSTSRRGSSLRLDDWVLYRIHKKSNNLQFTYQEQEDSLDMASSAKPNPIIDLTESPSLTDLLNGMDYSALDGGPPDVSWPSSQSTINYSDPYQALNFANMSSYMSQEAYLDDINNGRKRKRVANQHESLQYDMLEPAILKSAPSSIQQPLEDAIVKWPGCVI